MLRSASSFSEPRPIRNSTLMTTPPPRPEVFMCSAANVMDNLMRQKPLVMYSERDARDMIKMLCFNTLTHSIVSGEYHVHFSDESKIRIMLKKEYGVVLTFVDGAGLDHSYLVTLSHPMFNTLTTNICKWPVISSTKPAPEQSAPATEPPAKTPLETASMSESRMVKKYLEHHRRSTL